MKKINYFKPVVRVVVLSNEHSVCQPASSLNEYTGSELEGSDTF